MKRIACMIVSGLILATSGIGLADNQSNCLAAEKLYIFSGTDAGAARRGLNPGTAGCNTASEPRGAPYADTYYLVPGATHAIASIAPRAQTSPPPSGVLTHQDGSTVSISWRWVSSSTDPQTDRWESQSIALKSGTGNVKLTVGTAFVTYQKLV